MGVLVVAVIVYVCLLVAIVSSSYFSQNTMAYTALRFRETLGYPNEDEYLSNHLSVRLPDPNIVVFVCMTSIPSLLAQVSKVISSIPEDYRVRKILVLPQALQDSLSEDAQYDKTEIHKISSGHRVSVMRTSRDVGPFLKIWAITDPVTSSRIGALRDTESKHIFVTLDDDTYYHKDLIQAMVNRVVETQFKSVVAVQTKPVKRVDGLTYPQLVGSSGVAYPARLWTSAFRADVRDAFGIPECAFDDDACISHALHRNGTSIETLPNTKSWAVPASIGANDASLKSDVCMQSLSNLPYL